LCGDDLEVETNTESLTFIGQSNKDKDYINIPCTESWYHPGVSLAVSQHFDKVENYFGFWGVQKANSKFEPLQLKYDSPLTPLNLRSPGSQEVYSNEFKILNSLLITQNNEK